jgi:hypothetical protein
MAPAVPTEERQVFTSTERDKGRRPGRICQQRLSVEAGRVSVETAPVSVVSAAVSVIIGAEKLLEVPPELIRTALDLELQEGTVIADRVGETPCVFLAGLHRAERTIAERLTRLANGKLPWPWIDLDKALPWVEGRIGLALAESQVAAIRLALMSKLFGHDRWPRRWQNYHRQCHSAHPRREGHQPSAVRPDWPRCETHD